MSTITKRSFVPKTVVKRKDDGMIGVVCPDLPGILSPEEVSVVYDGSTMVSGTDWTLLEIVGQENANADLTKCGAGRGKDACIFLIMRPEGLSCERFGSRRWDLIFQTMKAKRNPESLFPKCQFSE